MANKIPGVTITGPLVCRAAVKWDGNADMSGGEKVTLYVAPDFNGAPVEATLRPDQSPEEAMMAKTVMTQLAQGDIVTVVGTASSYQGKMSLKVTQLNVLEGAKKG